MKLFLKALLITHIISLLFVNIISFKQFSKNETKIQMAFGLLSTTDDIYKYHERIVKEFVKTLTDK